MQTKPHQKGRGSAAFQETQEGRYPIINAGNEKHLMNALKDPFSKIMSGALDLILPPRCIVSGDLVDRQGMVSPEIWAKLNFIAAPHCDKCGMPFEFQTEGPMTCAPCLENPPPYGKARSSMKYDDTSRDIILGFKHADKTHVVKAFAPWLKRAGDEILQQTDILIPVPLHRWRFIKRRYNQAALIARELSRECGIPCLPDGLKRIKATKSQGHLKESERQKNVHKAFAPHPKHTGKIQKAHITLIDDVYTTGATVRECVKVLKESGAAEVNVLTIAKVVRD